MKTILGFISGSLSPLFLATPVFAQKSIDICPPGAFAALCEFAKRPNPAGDLIKFVIILALLIGAIIGILFLIYGGVRWILSGGDKTAVENARNTIVAAIVGLVIIALSFFILGFIANIFGIKVFELALPAL